MTATGRTSATRLEQISAQAMVAGCVAGVLFAIVSMIGWSAIIAGTAEADPSGGVAR